MDSHILEAMAEGGAFDGITEEEMMRQMEEYAAYMQEMGEEADFHDEL